VRSATVALLLLASFAPTGVAECTERGCTDAWSVDDGSCTAGGSERNVVAANTSQADAHPDHPAASFGATRVHLETFCLRSGEDEYREVRLAFSTDRRIDANDTLVLWSFDGEACRLDAHRAPPGGRSEVTPVGCPSNTPPPRVPPLLP